jgi:hypothetical protein
MKEYKIGFFDWLFNKEQYIQILYFIYLVERRQVAKGIYHNSITTIKRLMSLRERYQSIDETKMSEHFRIVFPGNHTLLNNLLSANMFYLEYHTGERVTLEFDGKSSDTVGIYCKLTDKGLNLLLKHWKNYWKK